MKLFVLGILFTIILLPGVGQDMDVYNNCPPEGNVSSSNAPARKQQLELLNRLKNRYNLPGPSDFDSSVTLEALLASAGKPDRDKFNINKAATIEGYIVYAANKGSEETCNCKASSAYYTDQHLELALSPDEPKDARTITVEITPRLREIMRQQGIDWTHSEIKQYEGRKVRVSGWLFYDSEHEKDACSYNPSKCGDVPRYNRQTCWEIHPVTAFEDITEEYVSVGYDETADISSASVVPISTRSESIAITKTKEPMDYLILILLGGILGTVGQLLRVIIGLKKAADANIVTDYKRTSLSLVLAFAVGGVAGILAAINTVDSSVDKSTLLAFLTAGYAGTDFIEGFMSKNKVGNNNPPSPN